MKLVLVALLTIFLAFTVAGQDDGGAAEDATPETATEGGDDVDEVDAGGDNADEEDAEGDDADEEDSEKEDGADAEDETDNAAKEADTGDQENADEGDSGGISTHYPALFTIFATFTAFIFSL